MPPEDLVRIQHRIEAADTVRAFIVGRSRDDLDSDRMLLFALVRAIEIIGEAASRVRAPRGATGCALSAGHRNAQSADPCVFRHRPRCPVADGGGRNPVTARFATFIRMLLARLAVSVSWQGRRLGAGLLKDALRRTLQAADIAGVRAFAVHAKDDAARRFYEHFGFALSPTDPLHLYLLLLDIRALATG